MSDRVHLKRLTRLKNKLYFLSVVNIGKNIGIFCMKWLKIYRDYMLPLNNSTKNFIYKKTIPFNFKIHNCLKIWNSIYLEERCNNATINIIQHVGVSLLTYITLISWEISNKLLIVIVNVAINDIPAIIEINIKSRLEEIIKKRR